MPSLHASAALLPTGWARDVHIRWDDAGTLTEVLANAPAADAARAGITLPGMANVHSHAFQRAMAGLAESRGHPTDDFWTWRQQMYRLVERLEPEDIEAIAAFLYIEMLKRGYTSVAEFHYLHRDRAGRAYEDPAELAHGIVSAASAAGIALTLLPVMYAHGHFGHRPLSGGQRRFASDPGFVLDILRRLQDFHMPSPLLRLGVAPHSVRAVDALMLTELVQAVRSMDAAMPVHMHISEQQGEVAQCVETHGTTPYTWVSELVPVDSRWCFIHGTHLTGIEQRRLHAAGACIGICPTTEANLGDGIFDFLPWFEAHGHWAIGGDSHVSVSPFEELRALEVSQRLRLRIRNVASSEETPDVAANLWSQAARNGAAAVHQPGGAIEVGRRADLVVLDERPADFEALLPAEALGVAMFGPRAAPVSDVYVAGRRVVEDGSHADEEEAESAFRAALHRLRSS